MKIKYLVLLTGMIVLLLSCGQHKQQGLSTDIITNPKSASGNEKDVLPVIRFDQELHDFGKLVAGERATYNFKFTNTGKSDLIIAQVHSSCGCTVPKYPKEAIAPGESGVIRVTFDSSGRKGVQNKSITLSTNCQPPNTMIRIKALVIVP